MKIFLYPLCFWLFFSSCSGVPDADLVFNFETPDTAYTNKVIPTQLRPVVKEALSHYPELSHTPIEFVFETDIVNSFMQAQPNLSTIFNSKNKRAYIIKITRQMEIDSAQIPIEKIPHKVLLGWIGHELGHISDYNKKNGAGMFWLGFTYLCFDKAKVKAERRADIEALRHGLANEIIATKNFILHNSSLTKAYKARIRKYYISPEQVLELVAEMEEEMNEEMKEAKENAQSISPEKPSTNKS